MTVERLFIFIHKEEIQKADKICLWWRIFL